MRTHPNSPSSDSPLAKYSRPQCLYIPCPMDPPGASNEYAICGAPATGCGPLLQFPNTCELHNYNCGNQSNRKSSVCGIGIVLI